jgi:uncharacterized membrane protein (UPF0127 family)
MAYRKIVHEASGTVLVPKAKWCDGYGSKLKGFMFHPALGAEEGLVLVEKQDGRVATAIHMFFVNFDLGVVWVNGEGVVVDTAVAKAWRPHYAPQAPARYVIEMHPDKLPLVKVGDKIKFEG